MATNKNTITLRKLLLAFVLFIGLIGCSKDEKQPDLTKAFTGTWTSQSRSEDYFIIDDTLRISKVSNAKINMVIKTVVSSKKGVGFPSYVDPLTFNDVQLTDDSTVYCKGKGTAESSHLTFEGNGVITGTKMVLYMKNTSPEYIRNNVFKYELTKLP